jgi:arylsulfatase A-like enzyme
MLNRIASLVLLGTVTVGALATLSCTAPPGTPPADRPNVLWIVWDTVRSDRLSVYGYDRPTTPFLERWAEDARVFENCLSTAGSTTPSHASMFTGLLPSEHGTYHTSRMLPDRLDTIAELLGGAGYQTYLFAANPHISEKQNFQQGFDVHEHPWDARYREEAIRIVASKVPANDRSSDLPAKLESGELKPWNIKAAGELAHRGVLEWLNAREPERPWFAFLNYMEAHIPYIPSLEFREAMVPAAQVARSFEIDNRPVARWAYNFELHEFTEEELEILGAVYDAALLELDGMLERLLTDLEGRGLLENTIVILASDHGEHLGEHHLLDHQFALYDPILRVPLIVHYPARFAAGRESSPVVHYDIFPTLLELCGVEPPAELDSHAVSLLAPESDRVRLAEYPAPFGPALRTISELYPEWDPEPWVRRMRAFYRNESKLICATDGRHELYDLLSDPAERTDLYASDQELGAEMLGRLLEFSASLTPGEEAAPSAALSDEERRRLEALGYLGSGGEGAEPEVDPSRQTICGF